MTPETLEKHVALLMSRIDKKPMVATDLINDYLASHKHLSSDDKKEILRLVWSVIRSMARLKYAFANADWSERVRAFCAQGMPDVSQMPKHIQWEVPEWLVAHVPDADKELPPLLDNPPIILRAIGERAQVQKMLHAEGIETQQTPLSPYGLILPTYRNLSGTLAWKNGLIEVQDEGAQLVALDIGVKPNESVFDFCAGAGGKSLIFAQMMANKGLIWAYDITVKKLFELVKRAKRAHIDIIEIKPELPEPTASFDYVVVDAPCSGTGTWRRSPHLRWHLTEKQLSHIVATQAEILNRATAYVRSGGVLAYITCSITLDENERQIEAFLQTHPDFRCVRQKRYSPARTGTDGFFLCVMEKVN